MKLLFNINMDRYGQKEVILLLILHLNTTPVIIQSAIVRKRSWQ